MHTSSVRRSAPSLRTPCATPAPRPYHRACVDAALLRADGEDATALQHAVDLVLVRMVVNRLLLAGLQAIEADHELLAIEQGGLVMLVRPRAQVFAKIE